MKQTAREVAFFALDAFERNKVWSDGYLKQALQRSGLSERDSALATRLCYGVLQNQAYCDFVLSGFFHQDRKPEGRTMNALRLGAYQILFLDKIPPSAAVNESVELVRRHGNPKAAGFVNAILRHVTRLGDKRPLPEGSPEEVLAVRYSHPLWMVQEWAGRLGLEATEALLRENNGQPPVFAQLNPIRGKEDKTVAQLEAEGMTVTAHEWLPGCVELRGTGNLERLPSFQEGKFFVQDPAARLAVLAAGLKPGDRVIDACAAPGGKSFSALLEMEGQGSILSCDVSEYKKKQIDAGIRRLGFESIESAVMNGAEDHPELHDSADVVIADVPCSGLGIIRKKPDIRYKELAQLTELPRIQKGILDNVCGYVKPGGVLLYSTCTLLRQENEEQVRRFLEEHPDFRAEAFILPGPFGTVEEGMLTIWPQDAGTDGFFICKLRRAP